ncbi:hypothetical protein QBC35DRAFT_146676 [Podospora australis]|uniref:Mating-type switching protein swi10 n=1 Tax=Podospora australis TaxID=1536484 RepID=A0AAN6WWF1_9PEZI|nr:hypothetical protein QBC35DRAFT_146676 [Podospora australis]
MAHSTGGVVVAAAVSTKSHTVSKLRKKLQKPPTKQKSSVSWRLGSSNEAATNNKFETKNTKPTLLSLPLPSPDLSDSKWAEFFRGSHCLHSDDSESQETLTMPAVHIIPELSHLVNTSDPEGRTSTSSSDSSPTNPRPTMRRRAKTPIFSIGQLDTPQRPGNALGRTSSVDLIAEQYRALLDSRNSVYTDSHSESPPSRQGNTERPLSIRRQHSSDHLRADAESQRPINLATSSSPVSSDDGTLVSFEEETVYFKPVSFSPEPSPRPPPSVTSPTPAPGTLSLQICLDLLTRDLSSALASRPSRTAPETSALQVWVMIEAYERLRDQLPEARLSCEEYVAVEGMLNMWLRALYNIHDTLTGGDQRSESDYGELETPELD